MIAVVSWGWPEHCQRRCRIPPPPAPKTTFEGDGTYAVGKDIAPAPYGDAAELLDVGVHSTAYHPSRLRPM